MGFLKPKSAVFVPKHDYTKIEVCPHYLLWDSNLSKVPMKLDYMYARPTWQHIINQMKLFDHTPGLEDTPLDPEMQFDFKWSSDQIIEFLTVQKIYSEQISLEEVDWNLGATAGFKYSEVFGTKLKRDALKDPHVWKMVEEYWHKAHIEQLYPIWKISEKVEYLKAEKFVGQMKARIFEIPPLHFLAFAHRLGQKFNKSLYTLHNSPIAVGINFSGGGFMSLVEKLKTFYVKGMGDAERWDKYYGWHLRKWCKYIRIGCINPNYSPRKKQRFITRMDFVYQECTVSLCMTPWMEVVIIIDGMKSGDPFTTPDNSIGHLVIWLSFAHNYIPNLSIWTLTKYIFLQLYSDDHLFAMTQAYAFLSSFHRRKEFYARCGIRLKQEDDFVTKGVEGLTFLGGKITMCEGKYGPAYDLNRIWSSIVRSSDTKRLDFYFAKVRSLMVLSTFHGRQVFNTIRDLTVFLRDLIVGRGLADKIHLPDELVGDTIAFPGLLFPNFDYCMAWWCGFESVPQDASNLISSWIDAVF